MKAVLEYISGYDDDTRYDKEFEYQSYRDLLVKVLQILKQSGCAVKAPALMQEALTELLKDFDFEKATDKSVGIFLEENFNDPEYDDAVLKLTLNDKVIADTLYISSRGMY